MDINQFALAVQGLVEAVLDTRVEATETHKLNGIRLHSLIVWNPGDSNVSSTIHLDYHYYRYLETGNLVQAATSVIEEYEHSRLEGPVDVEWFQSFPHAKGKICYRLINYEANKDLLASIPHKRFLDLTKVYYVPCQVKGSPGHITIRNSHLAMWGATADTLDSLAEKNTPSLFPPALLPIASLTGLVGNPGQESSIPEDPGPTLSSTYVLTNSQMTNGAAAMCYKGPLHKFSAKTGMDTMILPSSINETILLPLAEWADLDSFAQMVEEVNDGSVATVKQLSNSVYVYRKATGEIEIAREGRL